MDPQNSQCLNLGGCVGSSGAAAKSVKKKETPLVLDSGRPLVPSAEFASFPADVSRLVGDYLPMEERSYVEPAFAGVQPITLCLSQNIGSELASCWSIGILPPDRQWKPSDVKIDKEYQLSDYKGCLELLEQRDSKYCRLAIEVLVVKLSETLNDFPSILYDLRITIEELKHHLRSVKHVVFSIKAHASCCFTLNVAKKMVGEIRQSVNHSKAIFKMINDLYACWSYYDTLTVRRLFAFYFKNKDKPASEKYLAKFVIPLNNDLNLALFKKEAPRRLSAKIMWACSLKTLNDYKHFDRNITRRCLAYYSDLPSMKIDALVQFRQRWPNILDFQDNPFIERIVINFTYLDIPILLPRPSMSLIDASPYSALIELTLKKIDSFDLTLLNNGYFPHLAHVCLMIKKTTGHLDSQSVPSLKTLTIDTDVPFHLGAAIQECLQSLLRADRPWQLVACQDEMGWSLASYDNPIANPQDDGKEDAPPSPPFIKKLLLVIHIQKNAIEFQSRLKGGSFLKAAAGNQKNGLLMWLPERVEKINAFCTEHNHHRLEFTTVIPGHTRILSSLACQQLEVALSGTELPNLRSLDLMECKMTLSGSFPLLETLYIEHGTLLSLWEVNAPMLQCLKLLYVHNSNRLSVRLALLPHLSDLLINSLDNMYHTYPKILVDGNSLELSHLELDIDPCFLPSYWYDTVWQCETLSIFVSADDHYRNGYEIVDVAELPPLPQVRKLTVRMRKCEVSLDSLMPELTDCTIDFRAFLGPDFKCPKLTRICYIGKLSDVEKAKRLERATYEAMDAKPKEIIFAYKYELHKMTWDVDPNETKALSLDEPLEEAD